MPHSLSVSRAPTPDGDIKVIPQRHEKVVFIDASKQARQSLSQWLIQAGLERAERQGFTPKAKKGK